MEEEVRKLRSEVDRLKKEYEIALGRINGLNLALLVLARYRGQPASAVIAELLEAIERTQATSLPTPLPDETVQETTRVAQQIVEVLAHAQREGY